MCCFTLFSYFRVFLRLISFMCMNVCLHICLVYLVPAEVRGGIGFHGTVVRCHVCAGNQIQILCKMAHWFGKRGFSGFITQVCLWFSIWTKRVFVRASPAIVLQSRAHVCTYACVSMSLVSRVCLDCSSPYSLRQSPSWMLTRKVSCSGEPISTF